MSVTSQIGRTTRWMSLLGASLLGAAACSGSTDLKNHAPQILVDQSSPPFGSVQHNTSDLFDFAITIEDPDIARESAPDTLYARLLRVAADGTSLVFIADLTSLARTVDDPERVAGRFAALQYCQIFSGAPSTDVIVVASDRPFVDAQAADASVSPDGATDRRQWTLKCQ